jgi:preprotein translocase subunit SecB
LSDTSQPNAAGADSSAQTTGETTQRRRIISHSQHIKDLSFENPNAGQPFTTKNPPKIDISIGVKGRAIAENQQEVELSITAKATLDDKPVFVTELTYSGRFTITGVPAEQIEPTLLIECPRLLFPFARRIIADCSRDGGYPPLMLEPIDFAQMYMNRKREKDTATPAAKQ